MMQGRSPALLTILALHLSAPAASAQVVVTLDPSVRHQTMLGWEATAEANQGDPAFPAYKDEVFDLMIPLAVNLSNHFPSAIRRAQAERNALTKISKTRDFCAPGTV